MAVPMAAVRITRRNREGIRSRLAVSAETTEKKQMTAVMIMKRLRTIMRAMSSLLIWKENGEWLIVILIA
ncbi:MAG: hypothetical protein ABIH36_04145 [bacterium]